MSAQPEALRLADEIAAMLPTYVTEPVAAELRRLHSHEFANEVWQVKTQWVQDTAKPEELGMHRADVMRQRLVRAEAQRDALLEALKKIAAIGNKMWGTDWEEIEEARGVARAAIKAVEEEA